MKIYSFLLLVLFGLGCELNAQQLTKVEAKSILMGVSRNLKENVERYQSHSYYKLGASAVFPALFAFAVAREAGAEHLIALELAAGGLALGFGLGTIAIFFDFLDNLILEIQAQQIKEAVKAL